jgi:UrcA family protein
MIGTHWKRALRIVAATSVLVSTISIADLHCPGNSHSIVSQAGLVVEDADLDLSIPGELFTLYQRLQDAAMHVCYPGGDGKVLPVFGLADRGDCYSDRLNMALAAYDNLSLVNIHQRILEPPIYVGLDDDG